MLARRAATWPRNNFRRSTIAPYSSDQVERVLTDIDANRSHDAVSGFAVHGACSSGLIAPAICGQEHGRSIPLAEIAAGFLEAAREWLLEQLRP
jgi:hypothetical protein